LALRERDCVDALMFMFGRLAMMKECLFKSGLEGPLFDAPPFHHTHSLLGSCICMNSEAHTHTHTHTHSLVSLAAVLYVYNILIFA